MNTYKKVFIIGNGFDLDLGWNTRYSDFATSQYWPTSNYNFYQNLQRVLQEKAYIEKWFDLEQVLLEYAILPPTKEYYNRTNDYLKEDKKFFEKVSTSLTEYLQNEQKRPR